MELIRIGEGKLKVMLTEEDMEHYALEDATADCTGAETRRAVLAILDTAKAQIGFDAARDRISIRMFRGRTGGCELFVSCTGKADAPRRQLYAFDSASCLATVCRLLAAQGFSDASAYLGDDGRLFLLLDVQCGAGNAPPPDFLSEYGSALPGSGIAYLDEHAKLLTDDAIVVLSPLAITEEHGQPRV